MKSFLNFSMLAIVALVINVASLNAGAQNRSGECQIVRDYTITHYDCGRLVSCPLVKYNGGGSIVKNNLTIYYCTSINDCGNKMIELIQSRFCRN